MRLSEDTAVHEVKNSIKELNLHSNDSEVVIVQPCFYIYELVVDGWDNFVICTSPLCFVNSLVIHSDRNIFKNFKAKKITIFGSSNYFDGITYEKLEDFGDSNTFEDS